MVFILVPDHGSAEMKYGVRASQLACRVAHIMGFVPFAPLLHYATYLSAGELSMGLRTFSWSWLRRSDRIWLQFSGGDEDDRLDGIAYDILDQNSRQGPRVNNCEGRRPVYQLHQSGDDRIGHVPVAMDRKEVKLLLDINMTAGLTRGCM